VAASKRVLGGLAGEIHKVQPFACAEQEAYLNLARTYAILSQDFDRLFRQHGMSNSKYNVLRILRGAGAAGRTCGEIRDHMVWQVPDVTRLVDRLARAGLVSRRRGKVDRREVQVTITAKGTRVLRTLDGSVLELHQRQIGHLGEASLLRLSDLLTRARRGPVLVPAGSSA